MPRTASIIPLAGILMHCSQYYEVFTGGYEQLSSAESCAGFCGSGLHLCENALAGRERMEIGRIATYTPESFSFADEVHRAQQTRRDWLNFVQILHLEAITVLGDERLVVVRW